MLCALVGVAMACQERLKLSDSGTEGTPCPDGEGGLMEQSSGGGGPHTKCVSPSSREKYQRSFNLELSQISLSLSPNI